MRCVAHADPDPNAPAVDPSAQCESPEFGGVITTAVQDGVPRSVCQHIVEGYSYHDTYANGAYTGAAVYRDGATVPTERPVIPELFTVPKGLPLVPFLGPS